MFEVRFPIWWPFISKKLKSRGEVYMQRILTKYCEILKVKWSKWYVLIRYIHWIIYESNLYFLFDVPVYSDETLKNLLCTGIYIWITALYSIELFIRAPGSNEYAASCSCQPIEDAVVDKNTKLHSFLEKCCKLRKGYQL